MFDKKKMLKRVQSRNQIQQRNAENLIPYRTVGSFSSSFKKSVKDKAMNAGKHAIYLHQNNYPLASNTLIPEVCLNDMCMSMLCLQNISLDDVLHYKALVDNDRTKLTSKLLNSYKTAMISISDGKLHILSVAIPSKKGGSRNRQTHKIPIAPFGTSRRLSSHSNGSRLSIGSTRGNSDNPVPVTHGSPSSPQPKNTQSHGSSRRSFQSDRDSNDGTSVSFSLSHIYDIDIAKPGSREFTVVFYYPLNDSDTPPTSNFQLITLTFKADSPEKAVAWIKHLLVAVESVNKLTVAFAHQILRDEERIGKEHMDLAMLKRCQEYLRLNIDLWSIIKGFYSESVANSMIALGKFLKNHGDEEEESHFWLDYAEKVMVVVDKHKSKKELARSYIDVIREEVEINGVL